MGNKLTLLVENKQCLLADRIATETIFKDDACISIDEAKELLIDRTELSEGERCYNYLSDIIAMNSSRFDATQNIEKWGFIKDEYVCFYPHAFNKRCEEGNFSKQSFMSWAKKKQIILADKNRNTKVFKINGKPIRAIAIKLNGTISINDDGFLEIDSTSDLPFG